MQLLFGILILKWNMWMHLVCLQWPVCVCTITCKPIMQWLIIDEPLQIYYTHIQVLGWLKQWLFGK